ncbi:MAG: phospholipase D family protein [Candidatus Heimdallarchaeum aukensis]|uniref:Phospholipase D family protein n=1 Tax=Candidatus Heimdallarchaeum aukensis TaxID=2876573 RepID=A0A9Y1FK95_9ARCH|nr:MAG: phospholipase D family protein [Candidatus Heimdallarchaeum aukensis]
MSNSVIVNKEIYDEFLRKVAFKAKESLWIMTGVSSDFRVQIISKKTYRISEVLIALSKDIDLRIISGKDSTQSTLVKKIEQYDPSLIFHCPRSHGKVFIVDGKKAYVGSGNLTGTGMGKVEDTARNWEIGVIIEDYLEIWKLVDFFQRIWEREFCLDCKYRGRCDKKFG